MRRAKTYFKVGILQFVINVVRSTSALKNESPPESLKLQNLISEKNWEFRTLGIPGLFWYGIPNERN